MSSSFILGEREIDKSFDWLLNCREFDQVKIKRVKSFIPRLKKQSELKKSVKNTVFFPSKSQASILSIVENHITKKGSKPDQLLLISSGQAGSGKSHLIFSIARLLINHKRRYLIIAPTGNSAYSVGGITFHSAFSLFKTGKDFETLSKEHIVSRAVVDRFRNIEFLLIDEFYLLGCNALAFLNLTLQKILKNTRDFGHLNVLTFGDATQLKPVSDFCFYSDINRLPPFAKKGFFLSFTGKSATI